MPNTAMINSSGAVYNKIVADPNVDQFPGYQLVAIPDLSVVDLGWTWTPAVGFVAPTPVSTGIISNA